ncbi:hypothetical protein PRIPAC_81399 [Pristionchus pacificus]|uniref:Uncharacterized protein n=1 Tax=Pristionchus pacificus TaxID=54126 RepID=A0A8R1V2V3_PRIPA|nr:hypothetical protein PRIPAC_81399 [Pristionchus pacificus]
MNSPDGGHTWRLIVDYVDEVRSNINAACIHLESWQIASYTLSFVFLVLYILDLAASEKGIMEKIRSRIFHILRSLPWVHGRLNEDLARVKKELEEEVHIFDATRDFYKFVPERGLERDEIRAEAELYLSMGNKRKELLDEKRSDCIVNEISYLFGGMNPRDSYSFPGCRKMESEIVRMCVSLFHGGSQSMGVVVPSAAESVVVALSSARSLSIRHSIIHPTILAAASAAPSLFHAAKLLGMRVKLVPCNRDGTVDAATLKKVTPGHPAHLDHICAVCPLKDRMSLRNWIVERRKGYSNQNTSLIAETIRVTRAPITPEEAVEALLNACVHTMSAIAQLDPSIVYEGEPHNVPESLIMGDAIRAVIKSAEEELAKDYMITSNPRFIPYTVSHEVQLAPGVTSFTQFPLEQQLALLEGLHPGRFLLLLDREVSSEQWDAIALAMDNLISKGWKGVICQVPLTASTKKEEYETTDERMELLGIEGDLVVCTHNQNLWQEFVPLAMAFGTDKNILPIFMEWNKKTEQEKTNKTPYTSSATKYPRGGGVSGGRGTFYHRRNERGIIHGKNSGIRGGGGGRGTWARATPKSRLRSTPLARTQREIFLSAPNHTTGTPDAIDSIAKVALRHHIPLHVDCSLGGLILPFLELCDYHVSSFDFRLPGVTSISIDFSRLSPSPSSCALTLFRDENMMKSSIFPLADWPGGMYSSPSISDCLDGSAIAATWTSLLSTGKSGFMEITQAVVEATKKLATLLAEVEGITILGSADTVMVAFETENSYDIYHIIEVMRGKGWPLHPLVSPPAARFTMTIQMAKDSVIDSFLDDLDTVLVHVHNNEHVGENSSIRAFNHLIATVAPDRWLVNELAIEKALAHYSIPHPPENRKSLRTFSVEGRKLSMISDMMERRKDLIKEY